MILPDEVIREVGESDQGATVMVNRVTDACHGPVLVFVANEPAILGISEAFKLAIETARATGRVQEAAGWKSLAQMMLATYDDVDPEDQT